MSNLQLEGPVEGILNSKHIWSHPNELGGELNCDDGVPQELRLKHVGDEVAWCLKETMRKED